MKKKLQLLTYLMLVSKLLLAQTITSANCFVAGDVQTVFVNNYALPPGPSGTNVTWNFDTLSYFTDTVTTTFFTPGTTPYTSLFPSANLASNDGTDFYTYYNSGSSNYLNMGSANATNSFVFVNPIQQFAFPMVYNSNYTDSVMGNLTLDFGAPATGILHANVTSICDANGTLILPSGTYNNVIRRKVENIQVTDITFNGSTMTNYDTTIVYEWYEASTKGPLLVILKRVDPFAVGGFAYTNQLTDFGTVGMAKKTESLFFEVSPNPISDNNICLYLNNNNSEKLNIELSNAMGQKVYETTTFVAPGENQKLLINIPELSKGVYFIKIGNNTHAFSSKLIKN